MNKHKILGIVLLVLFAAVLVGSCVNGTFSDFGSKNVAYYIGFFGGLIALLVAAIINFLKKD